MLQSPKLALFALVFGAYAYFYQAGGWNQNSRFDLTRAIVERGHSRIDAYEKNTGDDSRRGGHTYCDKAPGVSWLAVPPYFVAHAIGGSARPSPRFLAASSYASTLFAVALPSALAVVALFALLEALGLSRGASAAVAASYGLGTLAFPYATLLYGHQLTAALTLLAFALLVRARRRATPPSTRVLVGTGLLLGGAVAVEYPAVLPALIIGSYAFVFVRPVPRVGWIVLGALAVAVPVAAYHWACFGGPFTLPYEFSTQKHRHMGFMGVGASNPLALAHILVHPHRGLLYSAPWLALAVPGAFLLARARETVAEYGVCVSIVVLFVLLNGSLVDWDGGWAMGARYLIPCIPFLAVLAAGVFTWRPGQPVLLVVLALLASVSVFLMLAGTAVKPEVPSHVKAPFAQYLVPAFLRGDLSVSTQTIDFAGYPPHGPRAAWNLGQLAGLRGLWSLLPLTIYAAAVSAWLFATVIRPGAPRAAR